MSGGSGNRAERRASARGLGGTPVAPTRRPRYGSAVHRGALVPGILGALALLAGLALIGTSSFIIVDYTVSILALVMTVFAVQARHWWWVPVLIAVAVIWNPVLPLPFSGRWWLVAQPVAGASLAVAGALIKRIDTTSRSG